MTSLATHASSLNAEPSLKSKQRDGLPAVAPAHVEFRAAPETYRHWRLDLDGEIATLSMDVDERAGLVPGYELKLNSYDLGVDIELYDVVQRLRFEHPFTGAELDLRSPLPPDLEAALERARTE